MVFVTGGTGFIGSYIIKELLQQGYPVRALKRNTAKLPFYISQDLLQKVEWVDGDVLDIVSLEDAMTGADAVIHAAAVVSFDKKDKRRLFQVNIDGTANVVNIAFEKNIPRFVHISSVAALGRTKSGDHVMEEKKWQETKLNTQYAISKYRAEMEVWRAIGEGLNAVILNPSTVIGFGDWNASSSRIFKNVYEEFPWYTDGINGFVDVEDVARACIELLKADINGERFIVNGENWPFKQLFNNIADGFGKKHPHRRATPLMSGVAWRIEKFKSLFTGNSALLTKETARVANSKTYFDNSKILKTLPQFSFTPLEQSIKKATERYLQAINGLQP